MKLVIALVAFLAIFCVCDLAAGQCPGGVCPAFTPPALAPTTSVPAGTLQVPVEATVQHGLGLLLPPSKAAAATTSVRKTWSLGVSKSRAVTRSSAVTRPQLRLLFQRRRGHAREVGPGACQPAACAPSGCSPLALPAPPVPVK